MVLCCAGSVMVRTLPWMVLGLRALGVPVLAIAYSSLLRPDSVDGGSTSLTVQPLYTLAPPVRQPPDRGMWPRLRRARYVCQTGRSPGSGRDRCTSSTAYTA